MRFAVPTSLIAVLLFACGCGGPASPKAPGPDVVVLVMDTTRADHCSVTGYERDTTPELEAFARGATVFRNAWSPSCWTGPAHASLFTGLRPEHHGFMGGISFYLNDSRPTLAGLLADRGWATGCFTNNPHISPAFGLTRGFEHIAALWKGRTARDARPASEGHALALAWAREMHASGRRFFLFVNDMEPHLDYNPPEEAAARYLPVGATPEEIHWGRTFDPGNAMGYTLGAFDLFPGQLAILRALYDGEIRALDSEVGKLLTRLRSEGLLDDAIVVVLGDHGENLGDHHQADHRMSLNRAVRHVPLIIRDPKHFSPGATVADLVRLEDLLPTLLEICHVPLPVELDGESLLRDLPGRVSRGAYGPIPPSLMKEMQERWRGRDLSGLELSGRSIFDGRFDYIRRSDHYEELYDVPADPREEKNLAPAGGPDLERMRKTLGT